ncbi:MAG: hypothetical protein OEX80_07940 [Candidatus Aminicenantes bacterium]|nr:hypothetical protein [Candidatus Aminicenantes bacterium]
MPVKPGDVYQGKCDFLLPLNSLVKFLQAGSSKRLVTCLSELLRHKFQVTAVAIHYQNY